MRIFSICCVKDENDVIAETLHAAARWSDRIFVLDNGSTDGTWETVQHLAAKSPNIVVLAQEFGPFAEEFRGRVFDEYRTEASPGDWWCRLDADEFYVDDPRSFLAAVPAAFGFVRSATLNFFFTEADVAAYEADPAGWLARPVQDRLRHYQNSWSEGRFVRHHERLSWSGQIWPHNRGRTHRERIRLKHYQYRSPEQITRRLELRQRRLDIFPHEAGRTLAVPDRDSPDWVSAWLERARFEEASWHDRVRPASECEVDRGDGHYVLRPDLMPALPSPVADRVRATVQGTKLGTAAVRPIVDWRHRRRGAGGSRDPAGPQ